MPTVKASAVEREHALGQLPGELSIGEGGVGICYSTLVAAHDGLITVMVCELNALSGTMSWDEG
ncbi:hypothetical protein [Streptomyces cacaoi]|uniref:hypothetical protein n=1 Tax=Streptomyces cacaoi TaxID=1898 RepID=UPI003748C089